MLKGIDAHAIDIEFSNPIAPDIDKPLDHNGLFGGEVIEPEEVTNQRRFALKGGIASVVIVVNIIEEGRVLNILFASRDIRLPIFIGDDICGVVGNHIDKDLKSHRVSS